MVSAVQGVIFKCDVPLKEYIRSLDDAASAAEKFIIAELDDQNLFVKVARVEFVEAKVKQFVNALHFTKPEVAPGQA
ncbi:REX1S [Auxenochlorella protothecoides x Auxenochlorella symbiontica]